jgi:hypothetical protein
MPKKKIIAFWLVPAPPEKQLFSALIRILAHELKAPVFEPHVTLFVWATRPVDVLRILKELRCAPIVLSVGSVSYSGKFTKTLFVRFRRNARLNTLFKEFSDKAGRRISKPADLHLSLCYKKLPAAAKRELASIINFPFKAVRFDVTKAVHCALPTKTARDVRAWRTIGARNLRD